MYPVQAVFISSFKIKTRLCRRIQRAALFKSTEATNRIQARHAKLQSRDICIQTPSQPAGITGPTPHILTARWKKTAVD